MSILIHRPHCCQKPHPALWYLLDDVLEYHNDFSAVRGDVLRDGLLICPITPLLLAGIATPLNELCSLRLSRIKSLPGP